MKDKDLINYNLFCVRKRFNLQQFLILNPDLNYESFCQFLRDKKISPPTEDYFLKTKSIALPKQDQTPAPEPTKALKKKVTRKRSTKKTKAKPENV